MTKLLSDHPEWSAYSRYCELLGQGLRKEAHVHLTHFIEALSAQAFSERKRFAGWVCNHCFDNAAAGLLMPYPLLKKLIEPTLIEWAELEPSNSEPHRWLGTADHLEKAIALNPDDEIAWIKLTEMTLNGVGYSTHELPAGYLGDPAADLAALDEIEAAMPKVRDEKRREMYLARIAELRKEIENYLAARDVT